MRFVTRSESSRYGFGLNRENCRNFAISGKPTGGCHLLRDRPTEDDLRPCAAQRPAANYVCRPMYCQVYSGDTNQERRCERDRVGESFDARTPVLGNNVRETQADGGGFVGVTGRKRPTAGPGCPKRYWRSRSRDHHLDKAVKRYGSKQNNQQQDQRPPTPLEPRQNRASNKDGNPETQLAACRRASFHNKGQNIQAMSSDILNRGSIERGRYPSSYRCSG